jgi:ABC-type branched-subunit amino acid transport system ATPase component
MALLEIRGVSKTFRILRALEGVDVDVKAGTFHGLIGPNGSPIKAQCTLVIVEHDLHFIRDICDHLTVLDQGRVLDHGDVETIQRSPKVQQVFTPRV